MEAHAAQAAALRDRAGIPRAFLGDAALLSVRALNGAGALTPLPAMHRVVYAVRPGLLDPKAALYGYWMEWRTSNQRGRPLSIGIALRLTGEGSATSLHSSALVLLHALRTCLSMDAAPGLDQARATCPGGMYEVNAALHLLYPRDEDLEVGGVTRFVEGAGETPSRPRLTNPLYDGIRPTPSIRRRVRRFPREPTWCSALPPATRAPRSWAHPHLSPTLSRTRGAHHGGQVLWQEHPGTCLLLLVVATRGYSERVLGATTTHLYGAAPVPRPALPTPEARDGILAFLQIEEVTAVTGVHLVRLCPATFDDPRGPRALRPAPDWELWRSVWAEWLARLAPRCRRMATAP